jgi:hypothetical protein
VTNALAYYDMATITAVKSYIVQAPVVILYHFWRKIESKRFASFDCGIVIVQLRVERNKVQVFIQARLGLREGWKKRERVEIDKWRERERGRDIEMER